MDNITMVNEMMAVLGFMIPSAVLWQVWTIKASFLKTQEQVDKLTTELSQLKRMYEDEMMIKSIKI